MGSILPAILARATLCAQEKRSQSEGAFLCHPMKRTIEYDPDIPAIKMIDQRQLPARVDILTLMDLHQVVAAIKDMAVRGAPAIGITAAFGMAMVGQQSQASHFETWAQDLQQAGDRLLAARPTAVNLRWAVERVHHHLETLQGVPLEVARKELSSLVQQMADEDVAVNRSIAQHGAELLPDPATVLHHCNTGALAAVDYGTALGVIRFAHEMGKKVHVFVDETRPRLQGARLTAWELERYGISYDLICDSAAGFFLQKGDVDVVLVGADRIAANGDVANKIGTYMLALAAQASSVPFFCVAPRSTFDLQTIQGSDIPIEDRDPSELLSIQLGGQPIAPGSANARNPAFDITPNTLITAFITEVGLIRPPFQEAIVNMLKKANP